MWDDIYKYFNFPIQLFNISFYSFDKIKYHYNGVEAVKDLEKVIGINKHWYSTEDVVVNGEYENRIKSIVIFCNNFHEISNKIIYINHIIVKLYLQPSQYVKSYYKHKYYPFSFDVGIHLRVGDVDEKPFQKYLNKSEVNSCINSFKKNISNNINIVIVSDSSKVKNMFKKFIKNSYAIENNTCHSRFNSCIILAIVDMMALKYSQKLILTRGSTFSLFGMYQNIHIMNKRAIKFIGHDYEHKNYYTSFH